MNPETLVRRAEQEIETLIAQLPEELRALAAALPVSLEPAPGGDPHDDELAGDELGLFEGPPAHEEPDPAELPRIRLFLANLWDWADEDETIFREEVATTFLHELGHYLGWDEDEVAERGLE